jgi:hypothetical protein
MAEIKGILRCFEGGKAVLAVELKNTFYKIPILMNEYE